MPVLRTSKRVREPGPAVLLLPLPGAAQVAAARGQGGWEPAGLEWLVLAPCALPSSCRSAGLVPIVTASPVGKGEAGRLPETQTQSSRNVTSIVLCWSQQVTRPAQVQEMWE